LIVAEDDRVRDVVDDGDREGIAAAKDDAAATQIVKGAGDRATCEDGEGVGVVRHEAVVKGNFKLRAGAKRGGAGHGDRVVFGRVVAVAVGLDGAADADGDFTRGERVVSGDGGQTGKHLAVVGVAGRQDGGGSILDQRVGRAVAGEVGGDDRAGIEASAGPVEVVATRRCCGYAACGESAGHTQHATAQVVGGGVIGI
jgi:hypothetical protein